MNSNILIPKEWRKDIESLIFLTEKMDGRIKGITCANVNTQQSCASNDGVSSPSDATEYALVTAAIITKEEHDAMMLDVPNYFPKTSLHADEATE